MTFHSLWGYLWWWWWLLLLLLHCCSFPSQLLHQRLSANYLISLCSGLFGLGLFLDRTGLYFLKINLCRYEQAFSLGHLCLVCLLVLGWCQPVGLSDWKKLPAAAGKKKVNRNNKVTDQKTKIMSWKMLKVLHTDEWNCWVVDYSVGSSLQGTPFTFDTDSLFVVNIKYEWEQLTFLVI